MPRLSPRNKSSEGENPPLSPPPPPLVLPQSYCLFLSLWGPSVLILNFWWRVGICLQAAGKAPLGTYLDRRDVLVEPKVFTSNGSGRHFCYS